MEPTSLSELLKDEGITCVPYGLTVTIHPSWVLDGEDRLSYTTLIRLIECCREHHWNLDILSRAKSIPIDSITKSISGNFTHPIIVGSTVSITYQVTEVRRKGYSLRFEVHEAVNQKLCATVDLISIFYDPEAHIAVEPPASVFNQLSKLQSISKRSLMSQAHVKSGD